MFLVTMTLAMAQEPVGTPHLPQDMLAGRVAALEQRVATLERHAGVTPTQPAAQPATFNAANYRYDPATNAYWPVGTMPTYAAGFGDAAGSACGAGGCGASAGRVGLFGRRR